MDKCVLCGEELKMPSEAEQKVLYGLVNSSKCGALYKLYPHMFAICPKCLVCKGIDKAGAEKIVERKDDLQKAFDNKKISDVDIFGWARTAEIVGFDYEILGDYKKSTLAYKASTEILDMMISTYISKNKHTASEDGEAVSVLQEDAFEKCKNALIYSKVLKRLTLGHCIKCLDEEDMTTFLVYFDLLIELGVKDECAKLVASLQKIKHPDKEYQDVIDCLINKATSSC